MTPCTDTERLTRNQAMLIDRAMHKIGLSWLNSEDRRCFRAEARRQWRKDNPTGDQMGAYSKKAYLDYAGRVLGPNDPEMRS